MALVTLLSNLIWGTSLGFGQEVGDTLTVVVIPTPEAVAPETTFVPSPPIVELDTIYACSPELVQTDLNEVEYTCTLEIIEPPVIEPPVADSTPPAHPQMFVAGYAIPDMVNPTENGLHVEWVPQPSDSVLVYGGDPAWSAVVPSSPTVYRKELFFTQEVRQWGCVIIYWHDIASTNQCDSMDWAPMVQE